MTIGTKIIFLTKLSAISLNIIIQSDQTWKKHKNFLYQRMQSSSNQSIVHHPCESHPTFISIDEHWLSSSMIGLKQSLLTCPICYTIPLDYPIQCNKCERLFCKKDYEKVVHSQNQQQNKCPTCKSSPWVKKEQIHITYKHMFDSLRLKCKICEENSQPQPQPQQTSFLSAFKLKKQQSHPKEMTKQELIEHLQTIHDMFLSPDSILYDYVFVSDQGIEYKLSWIQNLQINVRKSMGIQSFQIGGNNGKVINVNLKEKLAQHPTLGTCKIVSGKTRTLKRNKEYIVWTVDIAQKPLQFEYPQINGPSHYFSSKYQHQRYVFYSEQLQAVIEKNYQEFLKNERLNEFCLDVRQTRFRISFEEMTQTNTYTKNQKPIIRVPITLR